MEGIVGFWALTWLNTILSCISLEDIPIQQSSVVVAREIETLDFSMPSYDDVTKGGSAGGSSSTKIPSFNPFGDFEPQFIRPSPTPDAPAAPAPAPAAPVVVDNQPFEFKAPVISLPEVKAPELPSFKAPDLPKLEMPKLDLKTPEMPKFSMPSLSSPRAGDGSSSFSMPAFGGSSDEGEEDSDEPSEAMQFKVPDLPKLSLPSTPDIKVPSFEGLKLPSLSMPELPKLGGGGSGSGMEYDLDIPKFEMDAPKVSMPQLSLPAFPSFGGGGESASSGEEELEPQEVRDERAREARQVFLSFDSDAKVIEQQAREARNLANEKKKLANEAKDEACKTRPGGKWICLRNPFTAGF
jgi:hypothetical protein